jgi:acyl carrier protein|tara:strand:- start:420 stop:647 length:228 start_codon:yes stop_codon:yes gene_type:complete
MITLRDLSNIIGIDLSQVDDNAKMTELGADSVKLVMLVGYVEENTKYTVSEEEIFSIRVKDVKDMLRNKWKRPTE